MLTLHLEILLIISLQDYLVSRNTSFYISLHLNANIQRHNLEGLDCFVIALCAMKRFVLQPVNDFQSSVLDRTIVCCPASVLETLELWLIHYSWVP